MSSEIRFIVDGKGRRTHAVIPIEAYESLLSLKKVFSRSVPLSEHEIFSLSCKGITATGYPQGERSKPTFVIIKDSQAVLSPVGSVSASSRELREELLGNETLKLDAEHNCFVFTKDLTVASPSLAAALITGNQRNGLDAWTNREGFSLKQSGYGIKRMGSQRKSKTKSPKD